MTAVTFAVAVNRRDVLQKNLLASPCLQQPHPHELLIQEGFASAALAYNDAIRRSQNDIIVFVHQDVFLPARWLSELERAICRLNDSDPNWGVLGSYGVTRTGQYVGQLFSSGLGVIGRPLAEPEEVQTLDEVVLIIRKSSGLQFDPALPHYHLYGTDLCLSSAQRGMTSYALPAFCIHNTQQLHELPQEFYQCYRVVKRKWRAEESIHTSCITISRFDRELHLRRFKEFCRRKLGRIPHTTRAENALEIMRQLEFQYGSLSSLSK